MILTRGRHLLPQTEDLDGKIQVRSNDAPPDHKNHRHILKVVSTPLGQPPRSYPRQPTPRPHPAVVPDSCACEQQTCRLCALRLAPLASRSRPASHLTRILPPLPAPSQLAFSSTTPAQTMSALSSDLYAAEPPMYVARALALEPWPPRQPTSRSRRSFRRRHSQARPQPAARSPPLPTPTRDARCCNPRRSHSPTPPQRCQGRGRSSPAWLGDRGHRGAGGADVLGADQGPGSRVPARRGESSRFVVPQTSRRFVVARRRLTFPSLLSPLPARLASSLSDPSPVPSRSRPSWPSPPTRPSRTPKRPPSPR